MGKVVWFHCDKCRSDFSCLKTDPSLMEHFDFHFGNNSEGERELWEIQKWQFINCPYCKTMCSKKENL